MNKYMCDGYTYTHTCTCNKSVLDKIIAGVDVEKLAYETEIDLFNVLQIKLSQYDCTESLIEKKLIIRDMIILITAYYLQLDDGV